MLKTFIHRDEKEFKSSVNLINLILLISCVGNILFYFIEDSVYYSLGSIFFSCLIFFYGLSIKLAFSYYIYFFSFIIYLVFLSVVFQFYYAYTYIGSFELVFIFYFTLSFLLILDFFSLKRKGIFQKIFKNFDRSLVDVVDIFGERTKYFKLSKLNDNRVNTKLFDGNIFFAIILIPFFLLTFIFTPFVRSIPSIMGYFVMKDNASYELVVIFICTFLLNLIVFKFLYVGYSGILYFFKK